jgi:flagellar assembly protein FliH
MDRAEELTEAELRGYQRGIVEGQSRARSEINPLLEQMRQAIAGLAVYKDRLRRDAEIDLVKLALGIARRILCREVAADPDTVHAMIKVALDKLKHGELLKVRYHPALDKVLRGQLAGSIQSVEFQADAGLNPGDLVLDTMRGSLDVSVDSQIREMERFLLSRIGGER